LADHPLRTADIQLEVLGTTLEPVGRGLMQRWGLPSGLCELVHPTQQHPHPGARTVELAVRIARHLDTPYNWHNPALPDDFEDLGQLLNLPATTALTFVRRVWP
jgi:HD-like signal output (HDOD) protein